MSDYQIIGLISGVVLLVAFSALYARRGFPPGSRRHLMIWLAIAVVIAIGLIVFEG